jgi:hypothetical protein
VTPEQFLLVQSAQVYDTDHRPPLENWTRVPDDQVLRLLLGAQIAKDDPGQRPCTIVDQIRWGIEFIREHYGPGSKYAREHSSE